jgi:porin
VGATPAVALIAVALTATLAAAEMPSWLRQPALIGSWNGWRDRLEERGVKVEAGFITEVFGNPVGGLRQSARAVTSSNLDFWFDLGRLANLTGTQLHASGAWRSGGSLSSEVVGNVLDIQEAFGNQTIRLMSLAVEQSLLDDRLQLAAGRLAPGDDFLASDLYCYFVSSAFCGNPLGLLLDEPAFVAFPVSTWGVRARVAPKPWGYLTTGVYEADPGLNGTSNHGIDFRLSDDDGVLSIVEAGWMTTDLMGGRPGRVAVGGWYDTSRFTILDRPAHEQNGNAGYWVLAEQMVHAESPGSRQGLTPFMALSAAPDDDVNVMPAFLVAGLVYRGLFPSRDDDTTVLGLAWGSFSDELARRQRAAQRAGRRRQGPQEDEIAIELGHRFELAWLPWLTVQPDVQYIIDPAGTGDIENALALGVQLGITF